MFNAILKSLITILYENAYTNIIVNQTIKHNHFTDYEKRLYTKIVYGIVEKKMLLDFYLQPLLKGKRVKPFVRNALRVGVYAMDYLKLPVYYVVNEVVGCIKKQDYKASTFVNAILRKYQSQKKPDLSSLTKLKRYSIMYSLPFDLTALLYKQYQEQIISFFDEGEEPYNTYRINTLKAKLDDITSFLDQAQINYMVEEDIILQTKTSLIQSPLFQDGLIVAQDKSSMMVPLLLCPSKKEVILDACSAPGSKTMQMASMIENDGKIIAMDIYPHKLKLIEENAKKLGVTCVTTKLADAKNVHFDKKFDKILIDAPCSGLGVIRHKPDLKYQMTLDKIEDIKQTQWAILENISQYLKPNGILVYSTCTINKEENEEMIRFFLEKHTNFIKEEEKKVLPSNREDGFYICRLRGC